MKRKIGLFTLILIIGCFFFPARVLAAKKRTSRGGTAVTSGTISRGVQSSVKLKSNRLGLILTLSGFGNISSVSYQLTYTTNGIPEGVSGTIQPTGATETRELLFATCSKNVCRWHTNIRDARLVVTSKLKSGLTVRKPYRIKV